MTFDVVGRLAVPELLGAILTDKFIKSIHPSERENVPYHPLQVPILMLCEARSEAVKNNSDIHQINDKELRLSVTLTSSEPKNINNARLVVLRACVRPKI